MLEGIAKKTIEWLERQIKEIRTEHPSDDFNLYDEYELILYEELNCYRKVLKMLTEGS